jgi:putative SOS response-associated peptidase YedK
MCNLYNMTPKGMAERYLGSVGTSVDVEDYTQATVGPFQHGLMVRPGLPGEHAQLVGRLGQWGMIRPGSPARRPASRAVLTNNARMEGIAERVTYRGPWAQGMRCLILADWYQEPNWETGKNIWWRLRRADGAPWALAGLWSQWTDPQTGELVPNFTMITCNCDGHPLLGRLHKPDPTLPPDRQDKRAVAHIDPADWSTWLHGTQAEALALVRPQATEVFDLADARATDALLASKAGSAGAQGSLL